MKSLHLVLRPLAAAVLLACAIDPNLTFGANRTWNGGGGDDNWNTAANWGGTALLTNDGLFFGGTTRLTPNNDIAADTAFTNITFIAGAGAFTLQGNTVTLGGGITNSSSSVQTVVLGLKIPLSRTYDGGTRGLIIGGGITNTAAFGTIVTPTFNGAGTLSNLFNSSLGATNNITINGTWTIVNNPGNVAVSTPGSLFVNAGGRFDFGNASSAPQLALNSSDQTGVRATVGTSGSGTLATLNIVNGTLTLNQRLNTLGVAAINISGGTLTFGNGGVLSMDDSGTAPTASLTISGGMLNETAGTLFVATSGTGTFNMNSGTAILATLDLSRVTAAGTIGTNNLNGGVEAVSQISTATANNTATNGAERAVLNFNGGTLKSRGPSTAWIANGSSTTPGITLVVKSGGAVIDTAGFNDTIVPPLLHDSTGPATDGGLSISNSTATAATLTLSNASSTYTGPTTINSTNTLCIGVDGALGAVPVSATPGNIVLNNGGALSALVNVALNANRGIQLKGTGGVIAGTGTLNYGGIIAGAANTAGLTKANSGTLTLSNANTFGGGVGGDFTITGGIVNFNNNNSAGAGSIIVTPNSDVTLRTSANGITIANDIAVNSSANTIDLLAPTGSTLTFSGAISGTAALTRGGSGTGGGGTVVLSGNNSFSGGLTLKSGTLSLGSKNAVGTGALTISTNGLISTTILRATTPLTGANAITNSVNLFSNVTIGGSADIEFSGPVALGTATPIVLVANGSTLFSGVLSGSAGFTKDGVSTLVFTGTNTYNGDTTISTGTLQLGNGGSSGSVAGNIVDNSALVFNRSDSSIYAGVISGASGTVAKSGAGTIILQGANTYGGATTVGAGTLALSGSGSISASSPISVSGGATFDISGLSANYAVGNTVRLTNATFNLGGTLAASLSTLTCSNSTIQFSIGGDAATPITVTNFTTGGTTNLINISTLAGFTSYPTQLTVIKYKSLNNVTNPNNTLVNLGVLLPGVGNPHGYLTNNSINKSIDLILTSGPLPVLPISWNGNHSGDWDVLATLNWRTASLSPYPYQDDSPVTFDDTLTGTANVNLTTTVLPGRVIITNNAINYTFSGTGRISGSASVVKQGAGSAILSESGGDNFSGGIVVGGGSLVLNNASTYTGGTVVSNGTLRVNGSLAAGSAVTNYGGILSGAGVINGTVSITPGGSIQPGLGGIDTSTLTVNNALALSGAAVMALNRTNAQPASRIAGLSSLSVSGGALTVNNVGPALLGGDSFTLFSIAPSGIFAATNLPSLSAGQNWWTTNNYAVMIVNQVAAGTASYTRNKDVSFKIKISDLLTNVSVLPSSPADAIALTGVGASTNGSSISSDGTYIFFSSTNNVSESFTYTVADSRGGGGTGAINIDVVSAGGSARFGNLSGGIATVDFVGIPGYTYAVQRNTNLTTGVGWVTLWTTNTPPDGLFTFSDHFSDLGFVPDTAYYRTAQP